MADVTGVAPTFTTRERPARGIHIFGLDAVEKPHRTPWRAWCELEFSVQPMGVIAVGVGGVLTEPGGLVYRFGEVFREVNRKSLTADFEPN